MNRWLAFVLSIIFAGCCMAIIEAKQIGYDKGYKEGWLKGYRQQQIEDLPSPGIDKHITRNRNLLGKG